MHLTLHLTRQCNMRCDYCYTPPRDARPMSLETAVKALRMGARLTGDSSCGVVFFGGEPLLCRELMAEVVAEARRMERRGTGRFHFKVTTNLCNCPQVRNVAVLSAS